MQRLAQVVHAPEFCFVVVVFVLSYSHLLLIFIDVLLVIDIVMSFNIKGKSTLQGDILFNVTG